jgi:hypothetical protein
MQRILIVGQKSPDLLVADAVEGVGGIQDGEARRVKADAAARQLLLEAAVLRNGPAEGRPCQRPLRHQLQRPLAHAYERSSTSAVIIQLCHHECVVIKPATEENLEWDAQDMCS